MSQSEEEDLDFLAYSGSEYEPSSSGQDSDVSSVSDNSKTDLSSTSYDQGGKKKRKLSKRTRDNKRKRLGVANGQASTSTGRISYKPFGDLMQNVIFSLSGFVNPLRSELREKALAMGARYSPDWDNTCTHLICAFKDTPKYNQVRGHGKIVKKEWIEDGHSFRKRYPWRRYALDRRDKMRNESEDEIHELTSEQDAESGVSSLPPGTS